MSIDINIEIIWPIYCQYIASSKINIENPICIPGLSGTTECATEMIADWTVYGKMKYSFTRKCADEDTSETWEEQQDIDGDYTDKSDFTVRKIAVVGNEPFPVYFRFTCGDLFVKMSEHF